MVRSSLLQNESHLLPFLLEYEKDGTYYLPKLKKLIGKAGPSTPRKQRLICGLPNNRGKPCQRQYSCAFHQRPDISQPPPVSSEQFRLEEISQDTQNYMKNYIAKPQSDRVCLYSYLH